MIAPQALLAIFLLGSAQLHPALAEDKPEDKEVSVNDVFGRFGYSSHREPGKTCVVTMVLDRSAFIQAIPTLKSVGLLNPEYVTQTRVNSQPTSLAMGFAFQMAPTAVKDTYEQDSVVDKCVFQQMMKVVDDYGNDKNLLGFKFEFSRTTYKKVNWDKLPPQNLPKIATHFTFGPAMEEAVKERGTDND